MFIASKNALQAKPQGLSQWLRPITAVGLICAAIFGTSLSWGSPEDIAEVNQLLSNGKTDEAARMVQNALRKNANDVQMRFLQGVIATEQKKYDQAIYVFTGLARDYPGLPEPYNNLAVLYAAKGDDRRAAQVLEQAIRTNPSYATAHQNLGDLYARMANDAYAKALQLDSSRKPENPKLATINTITPSHQTPLVAVASNATPSTASAPVAKASTSVAPAPVTPPAAQPEPLTAAVNAPTVNTSRTQVAAVAALPAEAAASPAQPAPTIEAATKPTMQTAPAMDTNAEAVASVKKAVASWARAWEQQNMDGYYAAYSSQFTPKGSTLAEWKKERKNRIVGKSTINVDISNLKVSVKGDSATATFHQRYQSGAVKATTRKTLEMRNENGKWRILRENTGR